MRSSFFEFNVAITGIFTARGGMEVAGHNIANSETPGFSRQYAKIRASTPLPLFNGKGMVGTGSDYYGIGQYRSFYLDCKYWNESPVLGEYNLKNSQLELIETIFSVTFTDNSKEYHINGALNTFFNTLQDLSTTAGEATYRRNVIQAAQTFSKFINNTAQSLRKQQKEANDELKIMVDTISSLGQQIRNLNEQIFKFEIDGSSANDLRDARALLVDELSRYVNIEVREDDKKQFSVFINGDEFVRHLDVSPIEVRPRVPASNLVNPTDVSGLYDIYFSNSGRKFDMYSPELQGELRGLIDIRDGNNGNVGKGKTNQAVYSDNTDTVASGGTSLFLSGAINGNYKPTGGQITLVDGTGATTVLDYTAFDPATGEFTIDTATTPLPADINTVSYAIKESPIKLTLTAAGLTRGDYNPSGGKITLVNPTTGKVTEHTYTAYDPVTNEFLIDPKTPLPADINTVTYDLTVGQTSDYKGIPHYMNKLNELVRTFAMAVNNGVDTINGHDDGYDWYGNKGVNLFFTYDPTKTGYNDLKVNDPISYYKLNAINFQVNPKLIEDPFLLAASSTPVREESNNNTILSLITIRTYKSLFKEGKLEDYVIGISGELGIDREQAKFFSVSYNEIITTVDNQRKSVSGVERNEEATDIVRFQQLFLASSKLINVIDSIYDTLINRLGNF